MKLDGTKNRYATLTGFVYNVVKGKTSCQLSTVLLASDSCVNTLLQIAIIIIIIIYLLRRSSS